MADLVAFVICRHPKYFLKFFWLHKSPVAIPKPPKPYSLFCLGLVLKKTFFIQGSCWYFQSPRHSVTTTFNFDPVCELDGNSTPSKRSWNDFTTLGAVRTCNLVFLPFLNIAKTEARNEQSSFLYPICTARNSSNHELLVEETCCQGAESRKANMVASPVDCAFNHISHAIGYIYLISVI